MISEIFSILGNNLLTILHVQEIMITVLYLLIAAQFFALDRRVNKKATALTWLLLIFVLCSVNGYLIPFLASLTGIHAFHILHVITMIPLIYFSLKYVVSQQIRIVASDIINDHNLVLDSSGNMDEFAK